MFFGYAKYHSITDVLLDLQLPSFNTVLYNFRCVFLILSGTHVIMTWLCTIETYIRTFLYTNVFLSVSTVYILSSACLSYVCLFVTDMDPCGLKQIN